MYLRKQLLLAEKRIDEKRIELIEILIRGECFLRHVVLNMNLPVSWWKRNKRRLKF